MTCQSGITSWPLRGDVGNTDYFFIVPPVNRWDTFRRTWTFCPQNWCLKQEKWTRVRIWVSLTEAKLWWLDDWVRASPTLQLSWAVPSLQWSHCSDRKMSEYVVHHRPTQSCWANQSSFSCCFQRSHKEYLEGQRLLQYSDFYTKNLTDETVVINPPARFHLSKTDSSAVVFKEKWPKVAQGLFR